MLNNDYSKGFKARSFAKLVANDQSKKLLKQLFSFGLLDESPKDVEALSQKNEDHVGIWKRADDSSYVRDAGLAHEWYFWAQEGRIPPKSEKSRVVLLGESVARGYLYDPLFSPAKSLESKLNLGTASMPYEVVDLARTNLDMDMLKHLASEAIDLKPDALVIFAGNNWHPNWGKCSTRQHINGILEHFSEHGFSGFIKYLEQELEREITKLFSFVHDLYVQNGIPVLWIIPEFSLADWSDTSCSSHWLKGGDNSKWIALRDKALIHFDNLDYKKSLGFVQEMLILDEGNNSFTLRLAASCYKKLEQYEQYRTFLTRAKNATIWEVGKHNSPRAYSIVQDALAKEAKLYGHSYFKLSEVFEKTEPSVIPGRQFFLDYCHLTSKGIDIVMSESASWILSNSKNEKILPNDLIGKGFLPDNKIESEANFLAALHNAHWGQDYEIILHYCKKAIEASPEIAQVMCHFVEMQTLKTPIWMQKATADLIKFVSPSIQRYFFKIEFNGLDNKLFNAFYSALENNGNELKNKVIDIRRRERSAQEHAVDLLDPFYHMISFSDMKVGGKNGGGQGDYFTAYDTVSDFSFIASEKPIPINCKITLRLPYPANKTGIVFIECNQLEVASLTVSSDWTTYNFTIDPSLLTSDINALTITWPVDFIDEIDGAEEIISDLCASKFPEFYPIFGNIFQLNMSPVVIES